MRLNVALHEVAATQSMLIDDHKHAPLSLRSHKHHQRLDLAFAIELNVSAKTVGA